MMPPRTCESCGQIKPLYDFSQSEVCFACSGDQTCMVCGESKPPSRFRVNGKRCHECTSKLRLPKRHYVNGKRP